MLNIKNIRIQKGLSQANVAKALNIARTTYTNIENGRSDPDTATLCKLADFFDCSVDVLLNRFRSIPENETKLTAIFNSLNDAGQELVFDYAMLIFEKPNYRKDASSDMAI